MYRFHASTSFSGGAAGTGRLPFVLIKKFSAPTILFQSGAKYPGALSQKGYEAVSVGVETLTVLIFDFFLAVL